MGKTVGGGFADGTERSGGGSGGTAGADTGTEMKGDTGTAGEELAEAHHCPVEGMAVGLRGNWGLKIP